MLRSVAASRRVNRRAGSAAHDQFAKYIGGWQTGILKNPDQPRGRIELCSTAVPEHIHYPLAHLPDQKHFRIRPGSDIRGNLVKRQHAAGISNSAAHRTASTGSRK